MKPEDGTSDVKLVVQVYQKLLSQVSSDVQPGVAAAEDLGSDFCCLQKVNGNCPEEDSTIWAVAYHGSEGHEYDYTDGKISAY